MKNGKSFRIFIGATILIFFTIVLAESTNAQVPRPKGKRIISIWNKGGCSYTQTVKFSLKKYHVITGLITWRKWSPGEKEVTGWLYRDGKKVIGAIFTRGNCDGNQRSWCEGVWRVPGIHGHPGNYVLKIDAGKVCQNSTSGGNGYIRVYAKSAAAPAGAGSGQKTQTKVLRIKAVYHDGSGKPGRDIVIHQDGRAIKGTYHQGRSVFAGTLSGNVVKGRFGYHRKKPTSGNFIWVFSKDGKRFNGKYCSGMKCTPKTNWGAGVYMRR